MKGNLINSLLRLILIALSIILVCLFIVFLNNRIYNNYNEESAVVSDNNSSNTSTSTGTVTNTGGSSVVTTSLKNLSPLEYFEKVDTSATKSTIKEGFIKIVDFIFYGEKINGITFSELKDDVKLKILNIAYKIDSKLDSWFPGYKETIKGVATRIYTKIKERLTELYIKITNAICTSKPTLCENAKEDFKVMKEKFGITYELLKSLFQSGKEKLNDWYLEFKDN